MFDDLIDRLRPYFQRQPRAGVAPPTPQPQIPQAPTVGSGELAGRREELAHELAELQWDLGGLTYEMAIRDHFRLDVLIRRAARLQEVDAELGEVERLLHSEEAGAGGSCRSCGALHGRGAVFCWQCGAALMEKSSP